MMISADPRMSIELTANLRAIVAVIVARTLTSAGPSYFAFQRACQESNRRRGL